jgi:hypothetical protein
VKAAERGSSHRILARHRRADVSEFNASPHAVRWGFRKSLCVSRQRRRLVGSVHGAALSREAGEVAGRGDARDCTDAGLGTHRRI